MAATQIQGQLVGAQFENRTSDPTTSAIGYFYFNTLSGLSKLYNGTSWLVFVDLATSQTLQNKTLDNTNTATFKASLFTLQDQTTAAKQVVFDLSGLSAATRTWVFPDASSTFVGTGTTQTLLNKTLDNTNTVTLKDTLFTLQDDGDTTKQVKFQLSGITTGTTRTWTFPDATSTFVGTDTTQTLTNKTFGTGTVFSSGTIIDANVSFVDDGDNTKQVKFQISGITTGTTRTWTFPDATSTFVGTDVAQVLTAKDYDGGTASNTSRMTLPKNTKTNLDALTRKAGTLLYGTDTAKVYRDDGSALKEIGSGSSGINYLSDHFAADALGSTTVSVGDTLSSSTRSNPTQWGSSAGSALITQSTDSTLRGTTNYLIQFTANAQFVESPLFTLDGKDLGQPISISIDTSGVSTSDDVQLYVARYNSSNVLQERIVVAGTASATTPFSARLNTGTSKFNGFFIPSATSTDKYAMRFLRNANNTSLRIDTITVGPNSYQVGAAMTDWQSYTPTGTNIAGTFYGRYRRVGDSMEVYATVVSNGTVSGTIAISLPTGYTIDTNKVNVGISQCNFGLAEAKVGSNRYKGVVDYNSSTSVFIMNANGDSTAWNATVPGTWANGDQLYLNFRVPITEWSSNVQLADRAIEEYAFNTATADSSDTTSFGYGPAGQQFGSFTTAPNKDVQFLTPILPTDRITVEVTNDGGITWQDAANGTANISPYQDQNSVNFGLRYTSVSSTKVRVGFGTYRSNSGATYGAAGAAWSAIAANANHKWRVRKVSGGAAVGFPIQSSNIVGRTDGNSAPTGGVGEYLDASCTSNTTLSSSSTYTDVTGCSIALSQGTWLVGYDATVSTAAGEATNLAMRTGGTLVAGSEGGVTGAGSGSVNSSISRRKKIIVGSGGTTLTLSGRSSNGINACITTDVSGGITNPDNASILWAHRIA